VLEPGPVLAKQVLSQLSYTPTEGVLPRFISSTSSNPTITASFCQTTIYIYIYIKVKRMVYQNSAQ
jgi:hypothetical protein